jgi:hypothetical protein
LQLDGKPHYRKGEDEATLLADRAAPVRPPQRVGQQPVRNVLTNSLRAWLDARARTTFKDGMHTLKHANRESGWATR